ncbi:DUF4252 domain-containing protein [Coprobacter tertius]|uniref:DUF4252 domain-containing protein n=1 Tax=Coprobacter tertius TaxID=2944915 RepID=A0ABT1MHP6_9BACT|nr:DUF4252 domain-containing protein [Coprobacter tertius]MCP9611183.1 DUF4252 domain-containing protein [Coprobacter tertius]
MKKLFFILLLLFPLSLQAQNAVNFFLDHADTQNLTIISLGEKLLKAAANAAVTTDEDKKIAAILKDINNISMASGIKRTSHNKNLIKKAINNAERILLMQKDGETVSIYTHGKQNYISELIIFIESNDNITLISIAGKLNLSMLRQLADKSNIEGMKYLKNIPNQKNK